ncbi:MAG: glycosyltransferase family 39 protein [Nitrospinae bacterium]|nr:glycosyltransferase family 39 protein [Nitrospinota bacterium]
MKPTSPSSAPFFPILLFFITLAAAIIRFAGIDFGLPGTFARPDEELLISEGLKFFNEGFQPQQYNYPAFYKYILHFVFRVYHFLAAHGPGFQFFPMEKYYFADRCLSAFFGTATVPLLYYIVAGIYGRSAGILSSLFLCFSYLHARDSHFGTTDIALTFWTVVAYGAAMKIIKKPGSWNYAQAGMAAAFAFTTKYTGIIAVSPVLAAHWLVKRNCQPFPRDKAGKAKPATDGFLFVFVPAVLFFSFLSSPYLFLKAGDVYKDISLLFNALHVSSSGGNASIIHHLTFTFYYGLGLPLYIAAAAGLAYLFSRKKREDWATVAFPSAYLLIMGMAPVKYVRYMLPAIPFFCVAAGVLWAEASKKIEKLDPWFFYGLQAALLAGVLLPSARNILFFDRMALRTDSRVLASQWIKKNVPRESNILVHASEGTLDMPYDLDGYNLSWLSKGGDAKVIPEIKMDRAIIDYIIIAKHSYFADRSIQYETARFLADIIKKRGREVFSLKPYIFTREKGKAPVYDLSDVFYIPLAPTGLVLYPGPGITIYKIER